MNFKKISFMASVACLGTWMAAQAIGPEEYSQAPLEAPRGLLIKENNKGERIVALVNQEFKAPQSDSDKKVLEAQFKSAAKVVAVSEQTAKEYDTNGAQSEWVYRHRPDYGSYRWNTPIYYSYYPRQNRFYGQGSYATYVPNYYYYPRYSYVFNGCTYFYYSWS